MLKMQKFLSQSNLDSQQRYSIVQLMIVYAVVLRKIQFFLSLTQTRDKRAVCLSLSCIDYDSFFNQFLVSPLILCHHQYVQDMYFDFYP